MGKRDTPGFLEPHVPRKRFGQNFLRDSTVIARIVQAVAPSAAQPVVEIGPGEGALSFALLERIDELYVVEIDRQLAARLRAYQHPHKRLHVIESDALRVDWRQLFPDTPFRLVGNLPYNVSTPLLFHALASADSITDMHFMLQREVVERMAAPPGSKVYGRLSVMLQAVCQVEPLFTVPASAFWPEPKVESMVVRLVPNPAHAAQVAQDPRWEGLIRAAFAQRRKTLRNALRGMVTDAQLLQAGIAPESRAEQVDVARYRTLSTLLREGA